MCIFLVFKIQMNYFRAKFLETPKIHCSILSFPQIDLFKRYSRPLLVSFSALLQKGGDALQDNPLEGQSQVKVKGQLN